MKKYRSTENVVISSSNPFAMSFKLNYENEENLKFIISLLKRRVNVDVDFENITKKSFITFIFSKDPNTIIELFGEEKYEISSINEKNYLITLDGDFFGRKVKTFKDEYEEYSVYEEISLEEAKNINSTSDLKIEGESFYKKISDLKTDKSTGFWIGMEIDENNFAFMCFMKNNNIESYKLYTSEDELISNNYDDYIRILFGNDCVFSMFHRNENRFINKLSFINQMNGIYWIYFLIDGTNEINDTIKNISIST